MTDRRGPLPPLPALPPAHVPPPKQRISGMFPLDDQPTKPKNPTAADFAALASVFDALTPAQREAFTEIGFYWKDLTPEEAADVNTFVRAIKWLTPEFRRKAVEIIERSTNRSGG